MVASFPGIHADARLRRYGPGTVPGNALREPLLAGSSLLRELEKRRGQRRASSAGRRCHVFQSGRYPMRHQNGPERGLSAA
ncbi:hypothetical protein GCM10009768_12720 [Leucobacter iarius]|uniref:Uncharacterized protein n=1 Tax=Leucobacter iarius TaxID=333963 RepID=A0ABP4XJG4_9MICO